MSIYVECQCWGWDVDDDDYYYDCDDASDAVTTIVADHSCFYTHKCCLNPTTPKPLSP